jgi:hypothetical protein
MALKDEQGKAGAAVEDDFDAIYDEVDDDNFDGEDAALSFDLGEGDDDQDLDKGQPAAGAAPGASDTGEEEEVLDEKEKQRKSSWEGRLRAREQRLAQQEQELAEKFQTGAAAPAVDTSGNGADQAAGGADLPDGHEDMTDEELVEFEAEYPEVQRYMDTRVKKVEDQIQPVVETAQKTAKDLHFDAIRSEHSDFLEVAKSEDMQIFIDEAPAYARDNMRRVLTKGTAAECVELITDYKNARGITSGRRQADEEIDTQDRGGRGRRRKDDDDDLEEVAVTRGGRAHIPPQRRKGTDDFDSLYDAIDDDTVE